VVSTFGHLAGEGFLAAWLTPRASGKLSEWRSFCRKNACGKAQQFIYCASAPGVQAKCPRPGNWIPDPLQLPVRAAIAAGLQKAS